MTSTEYDRLKQSLAALRRGFLAVLAFSFAVNLLMLATPLYMLQIYDRVLTSHSTDTLLMLTLIVAAALLALAGLDAARTSLMVRLSTWLEQRLAGALLTASIVGKLRRGEEANVQGLRDLGTFRHFVTGPTIFPVLDSPWSPVYLALIYCLHPMLGGLAVAGAVLLFLLAVVNELLTRPLLGTSGSLSIKALAAADAAVRNADVVEAMGLLPNLLARWNRLNDECLSLQANASHRSGALTACAKFLRLGLQIATLGLGAFFVIGGEMTGGGIIAASVLLGRALSPVEQAIGSWRSAVAARGAYRRIERQLAQTPLRGVGMPLPTPSGAVTAENLGFAFPDMRKPLLKGVDFQLQPGEAMGLIGPSGSGKSTLVRLLLGNLAPLSGHARLDGMDISQWATEDRGPHIGYLPQDVELFGGSLRENIARMAEGDPEAVVAAAKLAGVHDMIVRMAKGYDTEIGENGMALSGGERQRIALARALYGEPKFVVLDEPNANLDQAGDAALSDVLAELKQRRVTTIIITHRRAVLEHVDKVLILRDGGVRAFGTREEMLAEVTPISAGGTALASTASSRRLQARG